MKGWITTYLLLFTAIFASAANGQQSNDSDAEVFRAAGQDTAAIQATVDRFRAGLGDLNPNNGQSFPQGRREINWDGVPDAFSSPNALPADFFNVNSKRGLVYSSTCANATFRVSAKAVNPTNTAVSFGEIDPSYSETFQAFSPQRLFTVVGADGSPCNASTSNFFVAGTNVPAETKGFGVIFSDVDIPGHVRLIPYDRNGNILDTGIVTALRANNGFSFIGVLYADPVIARVEIISGKTGLFPGVVDSEGGNDVVAMDDFFYGEPQPIQ